MSLLDPELVVVVARCENAFRWFRCDRELWVLDRIKWRNEFVSAGLMVPEDAPSTRFGIPIVDQKTQKEFLANMQQFVVDKTQLAAELESRFQNARSWWDVSDLFPIMFVNFNQLRVAAFYPHGTPMERYIPCGWTSKFEDFATVYSESEFPIQEKFWVRKGTDLLAVLNQRGVQLESQRQQ